MIKVLLCRLEIFEVNSMQLQFIRMLKDDTLKNIIHSPLGLRNMVLNARRQGS